jgi:rhamnose transport system ATP-binding protein
MEFSIERNIALASLDTVHRAGIIPRGAERSFARDWALRLQLKYGKLTNPVWTLSGGNQQKAVLAKWLARQPKVLLADEPTRGVDIGAKVQIHQLLADLAQRGLAVIFIASDIEEAIGLAHRLLVFRAGRIVDEVEGEGARGESVMATVFGESAA